MKPTTRQMKRKQHSAPDIPVNTADSNARGDRMSLGLHIALILASVTMLVAGVYYTGNNFIAAINRVPLDWGTIVMMTLVLTAVLLVARSIFWLSYFGTVMLSARLGAWKTCESVCRRALKLPPGFSRGTSWASVALSQSLVSRGEYKEAIQVADDEWKRSGEDVKQVQNLGPLCVTTGIASQVVEDQKGALTWNERAIDCLNKALGDLEKPKKGFLSRVMAPQSSEWTGQVKTQLAVAYFNVATIHFNKQDLRRAKENFKQALDHAQQAPEFPQKSDIIKLSRDQLGRLKRL